MEENINTKKTEQEALTATANSAAPSFWQNTASMKTAYRMAEGLSSTSLVPDSYKGKPFECLIALGLSARMNLEPITVMQNSQVVKGNFTWKGSACKGLIDSSGKYVDTNYIQVGDFGENTWGYFLQAIKPNGTVVNGPVVTMQMAIDEGWAGRNPKWKTMPELMLKYRAAAFFSRTECPSVLMSFQTAEEVVDVKGEEPPKKKEVIEI